MHCFPEKFTQLAQILHDRRSWRSRQISTLSIQNIHFSGGLAIQPWHLRPRWRWQLWLYSSRWQLSGLTEKGKKNSDENYILHCTVIIGGSAKSWKFQIISSDFGETWGPVRNISSFLKEYDINIRRKLLVQKLRYLFRSLICSNLLSTLVQKWRHWCWAVKYSNLMSTCVQQGRHWCWPGTEVVSS